MVYQPLIPFFEVCMVGTRFLLYFQDCQERKYTDKMKDLTSQTIKDEVVDFFFMPSLIKFFTEQSLHLKEKIDF